MDRLTTEELLDLQEEIWARLEENFTEVLITLDARDRLEDFLRMMGMEDLCSRPESLEAWSEGNIVAFGDSQVKPKDLYGVAKGHGISKERIEFIGYNDAVNYDYRQLEYNHNVVAVMFGAIPHSTAGKGSCSSVIARMEQHRDVFPPVIRLETNGELKITKTNFRDALKNLVVSGALAT